MKKLALATALTATLAIAALAGPAIADDHLAWPATEGAYVYFINLEDGARVKSPVLVQMGVSGMGVAPAGTEKEGTGHHHVLIDRAPLGEGEDGADEWLYNLPADESHKHFGGGQTEVSLDLPAGTHTLQMVFGDMNHVPFGPQMASDVITITVE
ncbi:DUF4399 domain-containing protein [Labrenzia sp. VG12]|uniref:DUF4399 domain-containing protein n=1 Tax=Labrenzia sp. VG12 TaxID=2021862 RepID=UPI000B8C5FFD|nr:DUF4399 domain-containing protein [Labrenzia sp. VG12]ASP35701.1 rod shape-determining protein RodA [Labrenzia sp. VG12]